MALRGNLRDFTITQLLNLINLASKTGTLVVDGASEQAFISFREGKLAYARVGVNFVSFGGITLSQRPKPAIPAIALQRRHILRHHQSQPAHPGRLRHRRSRASENRP